ncbi:MAG: OsmC family protein [Acidimicrobiales bacterium]
MASIIAELVGNYRVDITNGRHTWRADEPAALGGDDTGPTPYDLLLGALASCTAITLALYADRKGITLGSVSVEYSHDRIHADDCETCDDDLVGMLERVTSRIFIDGDFDEATRSRLQEIAVRCPVHRTLASGVVFDETIFVG